MPQALPGRARGCPAVGVGGHRWEPQLVVQRDWGRWCAFLKELGPLLHRESFIHCNEASHLLGPLRQIPNYVCSAWRLRSEPRYEIAAFFKASERNGQGFGFRGLGVLGFSVCATGFWRLQGGSLIARIGIASKGALRVISDPEEVLYCSGKKRKEFWDML